jgi:hypothetical protein
MLASWRVGRDDAAFAHLAAFNVARASRGSADLTPEAERATGRDDGSIDAAQRYAQVFDFPGNERGFGRFRCGASQLRGDLGEKRSRSGSVAWPAAGAVVPMRRFARKQAALSSNASIASRVG